MRQILALLLLVVGIAVSTQPSEHLKEANTYSPSILYDYIIVGGGTAGCPLAATLSQRFKVLLLERGGSPYGNPNITLRDNFSANYINQGTQTPVQAFVSTEGVPNVRARVLGGGTSINLGFYNRASPQTISQMGLDQTLVNSSFQWVEQVLVSFPNLGPYQSAFRSSLLEAGVTPDNGASYDFQPGTQTGGSIFNNQGVRRPASNLFVYANWNNLVVLLHAEAQLILFQGVGRPRAYGVKYTDQFGQQRTALLNSKVSSEVILSAGAIGSPQLLLLSGIGPARELRTMGIKLTLESPWVGKNVRDNPAATVSFPSPSHVESSSAQVVGITSLFGNYIETASGIAISRLTGFTQGATVIEKVAGPFSIGQLVLKTRNVKDDPLITFNYFSNPRDLETCISGVNRIEEVLLASSFQPFVYQNLTLPSGGTIGAPNRRNRAFYGSINATIANFCKRNLTTIWHYHGGCVVGQVLDSNYNVVGTSGLRVVDGSTFELSPGTNPQATVMMLGRYIGVKILSERTVS